ncbi:UDP-glucose 4-epimerase GalE [Candidatus Gracilibacteria bacterium]|nr:UDP-glucose 4-epimerase GalE [Candidatus Gracilibacteria bacterium]NUJ99014.1 UDP-glucose 4-epimerase GalE [Candidatus Gracilibacteria bacterium]
MKKTILITGGIGYIGSHGVVAFEQAGYKTVIVDNLSNSNVDILVGIEKILGYKPDFFETDLRTVKGELLNEKGINKINYIDGKKIKGFYSLEEIFQKYNFDGVIHFAGLKSVGESCQKALAYFDNNIVGSLKLFEMMEKFKVKNIIFSSSATVYNMDNRQDSLKIGLKEDELIGNTTNPYGTTKFLLENILKDLAKFSGFRVINLRYFNPIGAHNSGYIGENPSGIPNNLLPYIMKVATGELEELKVFGNDYDTLDGTGVRDYIDVIDLIDGHLKAYSNLESGFNERSVSGKFETYNLGTGKGVSVLEMIEANKKVIGKDIPYKVIGRREGDLASVFCNPEKAEKELGWKTKISLEESLRNSWRFYNN